MSFQLAPKAFRLAKLISHFFCYSNSSKNITCPSGKLKTYFTSPIAKSTSPGLLDTTFFAHWRLFLYKKITVANVNVFMKGVTQNHSLGLRFSCHVLSRDLSQTRLRAWKYLLELAPPLNKHHVWDKKVKHHWPLQSKSKDINSVNTENNNIIV